MLDLKQFYKESSTYGFNLTMEPDLQYSKNDKITELTKIQYDEINE